MTTLTIPARFKGPPESGNGGYSCGAVAGLLEVPARIELRAPPPLDTAMAVVETDQGLEVKNGDTLVARAVPSSPPDGSAPRSVGLEEARAAAARYIGFVDHPFPTCFVCGPERAPRDGLRIFPGAVDDAGLVAATWTPDDSLDDGAGAVAPVYVWAALDCPSYFGVADGGVVALLAGMRLRQDAQVPIGEEVVVLGWGGGTDGRKLYGASALIDGAGSVLAVAEALWIQIPAPG